MDPMNGNVQFARTTFGSVAVYDCAENYMLSGGNTRLCQADSLWSGFTPFCDCKRLL